MISIMVFTVSHNNCAAVFVMQVLTRHSKSALHRGAPSTRSAQVVLPARVQSNCSTVRASRACSAPAPSLPIPSNFSAAPQRRGLMAAASSSTSTNQGLDLITQLPPSFDPSYVELAHALADAAARITRQYFRAPFDVETKNDASPVTIADKQAELAMRELLAERAPDHGVFGEEHGIKLGSGTGTDYMWVLDPIDGTKSFITGKPLFGTLISLVYKGTPILGIIDQPILRERWVGLLGQTSTLNGAPIHTRACADIGKAFLYATTPHMFAGATEAAFNRVRDSVKIPMYGCDCYAYGLLAAGHADLVCESDLKPYDYMALIPIIKGAGGVVTDWTGCELLWWPSNNSTQLEAFPGEVLAAGDKRAHAQALAKLAYKP